MYPVQTPLKQILSLMLLVAVVTGCEMQDSKSVALENKSNTGPGAPGTPGTPNTIDPNASETGDWDNVAIAEEALNGGVYSIPVTVSSTGHFDADRTTCGFPQGGVLENDEWNVLARGLNQVIKLPEAAATYCLKLEDTHRAVEGKVSLNITKLQKRELFEVKWVEGADGQMARMGCTKLGDRNLAQTILNSLSKIAIMAITFGCDHNR